MTPKEKAKELVAKYYQEFIKDFLVLASFSDEIRNSIYNKRATFAKKIALIAVDEILESHNRLLMGVKPSVYKYWNEVKQEIENI